MQIIYDTLLLELPYEILSVQSIRLQGSLNEHGVAEIDFQCKEEDAKNIVLRSMETDKITISENNNRIFTGVLSSIKEKRYKGKTCIRTVWKTATAKMDITKRKLAVTGEDLSFEDILTRITGNYQAGFMDGLHAKAMLPGFVLQYDETDWEFMKRLAAMQGGVLVPDYTSPKGTFFYGIRDRKPEPIEDMDGKRETQIDYASYDKKEARGELAFIQDCYHFTVTSQKHYELGQSVTYGYVDGLIDRFDIYGDAGILVKKYGIVTKGGVQSASGINPAYSGLHLPAIVSEVSGNQIRVDFEIDQMTGSQKRYFPYAVESSAWYCMPESGSKVHIYLPENDETKAYAVHSMRNTTAGAKNEQATQNPGVKSFTHPSGSSMQMDAGSLTLNSDATGQAQAVLGSDGTLGLRAKKITIKAAGKVSIGVGEVNTENIAITSGADISLLSEQGAFAYIEQQTFLQGQSIRYTAKIQDEMTLPDAIVNRNEGIAEKIADVNHGAKQVQLQKVQESKSKFGMGVFAMVAGAVAIAAVAVCTCGVGLIAVGAVAGGTAIVCGAAMAAEGVSDYKKTMESGDYSKSFNFIRDTIFQGNQTLYDIVTYGSVLICGIVVATATGGGGLEALKTVLARTGTEMGIDTAMSMAMDYMDDGSINNGWESYFKNMCTTGCTAGLSMGAMDKFKQLEKAGKYSCEEIGRMRLATDMALDTLVSVATTGDADLAQIYLRNYLSNKLCLSDPVDGATGSLYIPATDMRVPDFYEDYCITRKYESINRRTGMLGYGWTCSLESLLSERSGCCMILCTDGHVESFHKRAGSWHNDKGNSERMQLLEYADEWRLYDAAERMQYVYDRSGRLQEIIERHGKSSKYLYENGVLCAVTTFAGTRIEVTIRDGRLRELRDVLGRTVTYTYDRKRLVCINQNGRGLTRYTYDKAGHIVEITDQNNKKYTRNTFDVKGRVTRQDYPDGTCCEISYDQKEKSVSFFYPETGGRETTYYNADMLVTRLEYQDGTCEEYGYDEWQNKILEKDRNGGVTTREYNVRGEKTKETLPNGLVRSFAYDECGNLTESTDTAGGCIRYTYDERNHLIQKSELVSSEPQKWSHEKYGYDHRGRMLWQEDGCGNRRSYEYDSPEAFRPSLETSPEGYEFFYTYDAAGRRTGTETAKNRIQFSYNSLHYLNHVTDGEGNELHEERDNLGSLTRHYSHRQYRRRRGYSYEYDHFDRLVKLTDPLGRVKRLTRNGQGSVVYESMLETPAGVPKAQKENGIRSLYDANDHATRILCPDGGSWERTYDAKGNLIYEKAPGENSRGRCYTYDSQDRLLLVEWEDGAVEKSYRYDLKGQLVEEENALGEKTLYAYDLSGRRTGMWKQMGEESYQATVYRYDAAGNVTEERRGSRAVGAYEEPRQFLAIRKTYDRENRLIQVEDGTGARVLYTYDIMNNRTGEESFTEEKKSRRVHYTYDRAGRLVQKEVETDGSFEVEKSVTSYTYDQDHNLLSVILPEGGTIRWLYDEANRPVCRLEEDKQHGISRAFVYRYGDACPLSMEELYPQENPVKKHNALFMGCEGLEDYTSEQTGQALCKERPQKVLYYHGKKAEGIYRSLEAVYHDLKVFVPEAEKTISYGEEGSDYLVKEYRYDFRGNLLRETDSFGNVRSYAYDQSGQLVKIQEPSGNESVFTYDTLGRLIAKTNGEGEREYRLTYDALGRVSTHTDGEDNTTSYTYHPSGGVEKVTGPDQIVDSHTEYDIWGRPERITDGMGNVTRYEKDSWGRVTGVLLPDGGREQYHYDYAGNVTIAVDALGNETHFAYRGDSRLESIRRADQTVRYFGYDKEGRCSLRLDENRNLIRTRYNMDANPVDVAGSRGADLQALLRGELPQAEPELRSLYTYDERGL